MSVIDGDELKVHQNIGGVDPSVGHVVDGPADGFAGIDEEAVEGLNTIVRSEELFLILWICRVFPFLKQGDEEIFILNEFPIRFFKFSATVCTELIKRTHFRAAIHAIIKSNHYQTPNIYFLLNFKITNSESVPHLIGVSIDPTPVVT